MFLASPGATVNHDLDARAAPAQSRAMAPRTILCIRHGQSTANVAWDETGLDPGLPDARLTAEGERQVREAADLLRDRPFELVLATPLTRALQTALGVFAGHPSRPRLVVEALHRERLECGGDVGRAPAHLVADYPTLDFAHLAEAWWHTGGAPGPLGFTVEPLEMVMDRVRLFRAFLAARPERDVAVVGHGTFFYHLTGIFLPNCGMTELEA